MFQLTVRLLSTHQPIFHLSADNTFNVWCVVLHIKPRRLSSFTVRLLSGQKPEANISNQQGRLAWFLMCSALAFSWVQLSLELQLGANSPWNLFILLAHANKQGRRIMGVCLLREFHTSWQETGTSTGVRYGGTKQHAIWPDLCRVSIKD